MSKRDAIACEADAVRTQYARRRRDPTLPRNGARVAPALERAHRARRAHVLAVIDELGARERLHVLDVGCGTGDDLEFLAANGLLPRNLAGVDLLGEAIAEARARVADATILIADGTALPFDDGAFDAVLQTTMLSSIVDRAVRTRVAAEMVRVVRPGGLVISCDLRRTAGNGRAIALDERELRALFGSVGPLRVEAHGLHLGIASRFPMVIVGLAARVPQLRLWNLALVRRAVAGDTARIAETYASYERSGHARRWSGLTPGNALMNEERAAWIVDALGPSATAVVVDVGCGDANVARAIARRHGRVGHYVGIDLLPERIVEARARTERTSLAVASAERLPLADRSADAVVGATLFSSLPEAWQRAAAAQEMARVIRPGGRAVIYDLRYPSPSNRSVRPVSLDELRRFFPGWRVVEAPTLTLLPPLARSRLFGGRRRYAILSRVPLLRSHLGVVLEKPR